MKIIIRLMKTELQVLFYSPVAWLVLVIFTFQTAMSFCTNFGHQVNSHTMGYGVYGVTSAVLTSYGVFLNMLKHLYLYIPLLTMGLMSRELNSGSIKLLYSSPISNFQIIIGKYLSMVVYGIILIAILSVFVVFTYFATDNMPIPLVLTALLGVFLTICAYAAIGLFMSTITSYQVAAAIGTLAVLATLNFIGQLGQDTAFLRDITYWLSISGRSSVFLSGLICSKDIIYFLLIIFMFISLSIIKLQGERLKVSHIKNLMKYGGVILFTFAVGYFSSKPSAIKYYDTTSNKSNTLLKESQEVVAQLDGGLTITTYVNFLDKDFNKGAPYSINSDMASFSGYVRFKPEIKMKYVYYYDSVYNAIHERFYPKLNHHQRFDTLCKFYDYPKKMFKTPDEIRKIVDLSGEGNRFVRVIERENGNKAFLRIYEDQQGNPSENEITAALKTLVIGPTKVGVVTGHGERTIFGIGERGYSTFTTSKTFRHSLVNQGFDVSYVTLDKPINDDIDIIIISDVRTQYSKEEMENYMQFVERGGNMIILGEPRRQNNMYSLVSPFGLKFTDGVLVQPKEGKQDDLLIGNFTNYAMPMEDFKNILQQGQSFTMPSACGIEIENNSSFTVQPLLITPQNGVWNEMNTIDFIDETPKIDPKLGEQEKEYNLMVYVKRKVNDKEQRIFVIGDADCFSNGEITISRKGIRTANYSMIIAMFRQLSYDKFPIKTTKVHPIDNGLRISNKAMPYVNVIFKWIFPAILLFTYLAIWYRRRGR